MGRKYDAMVAGHLCLDMIPQFPDTGAASIGALLQPGKLVDVGAVQLSTGGAVSNTGIAMHRLGNEVSFSARIGDDAFGQLIIGIMRRNGHTEGIHAVDGSSSSYSVVIAPPGIDRIFLHNPGANNDYGAEDLDPGLVAQCRLFHFGYPPLMRRMFVDEGRELVRVFRTAKEAGAVTSCDLALPDPASEAGRAPWPSILADLLPYVDIFLPSVEEAFFMLEPDEFMRMKKEHGGAELIGTLEPSFYARLADRLLGMGAKIVSLKSGHLGFYIKTGSREALESIGNNLPADPQNWANRELWCPSFKVPFIASANGSGDCAIAGFLTAFLRGSSAEQALRTANCLGWQNVQALDATSGVRTWAETEKLLAELKDVNSIPVLGSDWHWLETEGVWAGPNDAKAGK